MLRWKTLGLRSVTPPGFWLPLLSLAVWIIWSLVATALNPANLSQDYLGLFIGYMPVFALPALISLGAVDASRLMQRWERWLPWVTVLWFGVSLSQFIWGWSLMRPVGSWQNFRSHGFYSHPLTLAYVAILWLPWGFKMVKTTPTRWGAWLTVGSLLGILLVSNSRTCLGAAVLLVLWTGWYRLKGKTRWGLVGLVLLGLTGLAVTDNPVSRRFAQTLQTDNPDRLSAYPDDRLAFWDAHWQMIKQRPIAGHGMKLGKEYRAPFYHDLGLEDFPKKYAAHNQYIQVTANSGVIGLGFYLAWLVGIWFFLYRSVPRAEWRDLFSQTLVVFALVSLTQDAFYDTEVRYSLTLIITLGYLASLKFVKGSRS